MDRCKNRTVLHFIRNKTTTKTDQSLHILFVCVYVCVCVRAGGHARACVRACVRVCGFVLV